MKNEEWVGWVRNWSAYAFPMRKTEVPQFGQTPLTAGLPFLSVTFCGSLISMLVLHFTQYAVGISFSTERDCARLGYKTLTQKGEDSTRRSSGMAGIPRSLVRTTP